MGTRLWLILLCASGCGASPGTSVDAGPDAARDSAADAPGASDGPSGQEGGLPPCGAGGQPCCGGATCAGGLDCGGGGEPGVCGDPADRMGLYAWGFDDAAYPGAPDRLTWAVSKVHELGAHTIRVTIAPNDPYGVNPSASPRLVEVAQTSAYRALFSSPDFHTILITTYSVADQSSNWVDGYSDAEVAAERAEIAELGNYLLQSFVDKTFILFNWEGDSALSFIPAAMQPVAQGGMVAWINARALGVADARAQNPAARSRLYSGFEFGSARSLDGSACTIDTCSLLSVAPRVMVDYYSWETYRTITTNVTPPQVQALVMSDLDTCLQTLTAAHPGFAREHLLVGEIGYARDEPHGGECIAAARLRETILALTQWGAGHGIMWQVIDNKASGQYNDLITGFGAYKAGGAITLAGQTLSSFYATGTPTVPTATCPTINAGGVANALPPYNTIYPDSILSIYGANFGTSGNVVHIRQGPNGYSMTRANAPNWYESSGQINVDLPPGIVAQLMEVYVTTNGLDSNAQFPTVVSH
jgi:hypothetical protein